MVIPNFLQVRCPITVTSFRPMSQLPLQDCNDRNPLIRALAIRTMSYIPIPVVLDHLTEQLRHHLKDRDPYVRKTAAICVAKLYAADPRKAEKGGFVELLRDLLVDSNATVVANAVAALCEIADRPDGVVFKLNLPVANKLIAALGESSEWVTCLSALSISLLTSCEGGVRSTSSTHCYVTFQRRMLTPSSLASAYPCNYSTPTRPWF
jgi:vesicle coat complex subunit